MIMILSNCLVILFLIGFIYNYYINPLPVKILTESNKVGQIIENNSWKLVQTIDDTKDHYFNFQKIDPKLLLQIIALTKYK